MKPIRRTLSLDKRFEIVTFSEDEEYAQRVRDYGSEYTHSGYSVRLYLGRYSANAERVGARSTLKLLKSDSFAFNVKNKKEKASAYIRTLHLEDAWLKLINIGSFDITITF